MPGEDSLMDGGGRSAVSIWMQAFRVRSLIISSISVLTGAAVAAHAGHFRWLPFLLAWLGAVTVQVGTNLTNVYYNYKAKGPSGSFQPDPQGSSAVIQLGLLRPEQVRQGGFTAFAIAVVVGLALVWMSGWKILLMGLPGMAAGYFYAGPPLRLGRAALGVITVFVFIGPVMVGGTYYAMALSASNVALLVSIPIGLLAAGIMHTNDLRDLESDIANGKWTLSTLLGRSGANVLLAGMDVAAYLVILGAVIAGVLPWPALLVLVSVPRAISQLRMVFRETDAGKLNAAWVRGIQLHMEFGVALIVGLLADGLRK
jgi:1,4-dihydroxy-2-naphthoate polyprenyltransferase